MQGDLYTYSRADLPHRYLPDIAKLMGKWEAFAHNLPPAQSQYYLKSLTNSLEIDKKDAFSVLIEDDRLLGFARLEWKIKGSNINRASLQVQLLDGYETLENEIRLISEVVSLIPEHVSIIDMWLRCEILLDTYFQKKSLKPSYIERLSVSTLDSFDRMEIQQKRSDSLNSAKKAGFDLIEVIDAQFDESQYDEFVRVYEEIINDMPVEELTTEQRLLTVDKIRDFYDSNRKNGMRFITYLAIHDSGEIAGFTQTTLNEYHPEVSEQGDTGIIRKYRGHGLGLALKYQSLNYLLKKTDVKYWMTGNAASNEHMIRINDILLYKPWITAHEYEIDVAQIADLFGAPEG